MVGTALRRRLPTLDVRFVWIETEGDQLADVPLAETGGKGLFAKAIEAALIDGKADLAVHSLKDLPTRITSGLALAAIGRREDPRDCLISRHEVKSIAQLPPNATLGTASPRRAAQALRLRPDLRIELIRGNVQTRLRKALEPADAGGRHYDATLLAVSGLLRAGLGEHIRHIIDVSDMLPAAGQGALALQCRGDDHVTMQRVLPLNDPTTAQAVAMERAVVDGLHGDCHSPIAVLAEPIAIEGKPGFRLRARVLSVDGKAMAEADEQATGKDVRKLAPRVLEKLREQHCEALLARRG
jgi:hydroxymethylbilane synthase